MHPVCKTIYNFTPRVNIVSLYCNLSSITWTHPDTRKPENFCVYGSPNCIPIVQAICCILRHANVAAHPCIEATQLGRPSHSYISCKYIIQIRYHCIIWKIVENDPLGCHLLPTSWRSVQKSDKCKDAPGFSAILTSCIVIPRWHLKQAVLKCLGNGRSQQPIQVSLKSPGWQNISWSGSVHSGKVESHSLSHILILPQKTSMPCLQK